jgi:hypothetical protein
MPSETNPPPANGNADPLASASSALDWLYFWKGQVLAEDEAAMPFARRRQRQKTLEKIAIAEQLLLAEL